MDLRHHFSIPAEVINIVDTLERSGFESYLVGGCVRDLLLGKEPKDWDVTTNALPEQIQELFEETYYNNEYGTVGVVSHETEDSRLEIIEVTPYRTEHGYSDGRRPDRVTFGKSLEEDLARRDFTMNAIAFSPSKGHLIDPFKGQKDIEQRRVAAVGDPYERFAEDSLRILRALRLSAELGLTIAYETYKAMGDQKKSLENISKERIRDEFIKMIMSERPLEPLFHMKQLGLLVFVIPELEDTIGVMQNRSHIYTVFEHLVRSLQHAADKGFSLEIRLAALLHDIGKPSTKRFSREINDSTFYGHEVVGAKMTKQALQRLRFSNAITEKVVKLVRWHMFFSDPDQITLSAVRRMIRNVGKENIWDLLNVRVCDRIGSGKPKERPLRLRKYTAMVEEALRDPISVGMLSINGSDVMTSLHMKPGPKIGHILHALLEEVIDDPQKNNKEYLFKRAGELSLLKNNELVKLGESGKSKRDKTEEEEIESIRKKHIDGN